MGEWKLIIDFNFDYRVEPRGHKTLACIAAGICFIFALSMWFIPDVPFNSLITLFTMAIFAGITIFAFFIHYDYRQQILGPYISLDEKGITLRNNRYIEYADYFVTVHALGSNEGVD